MNDIDVIKRVQAGDSESFSLLVEKYHRQLLNFIYRLVGDEQIVEDIGQEVFLNVYRSMRDFDLGKDTPFSAWLFVTARNRCVSELRKKRRTYVSIEDTAELVGRERSPEKTAIDRELLSAIRTSLEELPEPYKATLLESLKGLSLEEIASKSKTSRGTVKSRIFRARAKMRALLFEYFGGEDSERF